MAITVAILGNRVGCSKSRALYERAGRDIVGKMSALLPAVTFVDADKTENPVAYKKYRPLLPFKYVKIRGLDERGKEVFIFKVNGSQTPEMLATMIVSACYECSTPVTAPRPTPVPAPTPVVPVSCVCPKCKTALKIVAASLIMALIGGTCGCTGTTVNVKGKDWSVSRISFLQKVANQRIKIDGVGEMEGYTNDGGSDIMQAMLKAAMAVGASQAATPTISVAPPTYTQPTVDEYDEYDEPTLAEQ